MAQLQCPNCGTIYDVSQYQHGHRFQCSCGRELEVGVTPAPTSASMSGRAPGSFNPAPATPGADVGMQPIIKVLVFLANLCFSPLAALISTIIYFVIRDQKPQTARDLCQMTWIPFLIAVVLWILYFVFVMGLAFMGSATN